MKSVPTPFFLAAACLATALLLEAATTAPAHAAPQGSSDPPGREVLVINGPDEAVPVTGMISVDGTSAISGEVSAAQSGEWTVGIDPSRNEVTVASADPAMLMDTELLVLGDGATTTVGPTDLGGTGAVRLFAHGVNGDVRFEVRVHLPAGGSPIVVDEFQLGGESLAEYRTILYELPGPSMSVRLTESGPGGANARVALYGK